MTHSGQGNDSLITDHLRPLPGHISLPLAIARSMIIASVLCGSATGYLMCSSHLQSHSLTACGLISICSGASMVGTIMGIALGIVFTGAILLGVQKEVQKHGNLSAALLTGKREITIIEVAPGVLSALIVAILLLPYSPPMIFLGLIPGPVFALYGIVERWRQKHSLWK